MRKERLRYDSPHLCVMEIQLEQGIAVTSTEINPGQNVTATEDWGIEETINGENITIL